MTQVIYSPEAIDDLTGIVKYISRDKPEAARRWLQTVRQKCELLATQPASGEQRQGFGIADCRCFSVGNYVLFFRPQGEGIEVARIIHGSRDLRNF